VCQSPSKKVKVSEKSTDFTVGTVMAISLLAAQMRWTTSAILSEFPKDFLFHSAGAPREMIQPVDQPTQIDARWEHGYEGVTNLFRALIE
jgi:hypothetical protein